MSVTLDLTTASFLLFRLLPFLVATVLSLAPLLLFSWKGAPYLALLLLTLALSSALGQALASLIGAVFPFTKYQFNTDVARIDAVCSTFVLGSGSQSYSAVAPLDVTLLAFSTMYLLFFIARNELGQIYRALQVIFPTITAAYIAFLLRNRCTSVLRTLIALILGGAGGWLGGMFVARYYPSLMYLAAPSSRQSCTRISGKDYTCRGGDHNKNAD